MNNTIKGFFKSYTFKFMVIGMLSLILLIPTVMIRKVITERAARNASVIQEISSSWSNSQKVAGPFLTIPTEVNFMEDEKHIIQRNTYHMLPEGLQITADITPAVKKRGIFRAVVYNSEIVLKGEFDLSDAELKAIVLDRRSTGNAFIELGITDLRGIGNNSSIRIGKSELEIQPGLYNTDLTSTGIHVPIDIEKFSSGENLAFEIVLDLRGSSEILFFPTGKATEVRMQSEWPDPSFTGNFLPSEKNISESGFTASWGINYLNRNFPQQWYDRAHSIHGSEFGTQFIVPVDHYQKAERSVKYAFMFIALTFLVFFLTEVISKRRIHPIQYLLVGFALVIFYTLLVSFSEHIGFDAAYLVSTIAITVLIGLYIRSGTSSNQTGMLSTIILLSLYGFLFTLLQLKEFSLLMGSIGLFLLLAVIMFFSRKINWYKEEINHI